MEEEKEEETVSGVPTHSLSGKVLLDLNLHNRTWCSPYSVQTDLKATAISYCSLVQQGHTSCAGALQSGS